MSVQFLQLWFTIAILVGTGCSSPRVIPEPLAPLVDRTVMFREVLAAPESYTGRVLVFGGVVLKAKRLKEGTQLEVLQLPLDRHERPIRDRQQSEGRFLAIQQEFLDPATVSDGTRMTIVGELVGAKTDYLDEVEYRYPLMIIKHAHRWPAQSNDQMRPSPRFSIGIGGGTGGGVGGGGGFGIGF